MDISFNIVTLNSKNELNECLNSLTSSLATNFTYEINVIDNGSTDGVDEFIFENYPEIKFIKNDTNLGYSKAMNKGLSISQGRYLVQLNPDVFIYPDTFQKLIKWMDEHIDVGISIPKMVNQDGSFQRQCRRGFARPVEVISYFTKLDRLFPKSKVIGNYTKTYLPEDEIAEVDSVSGSCMIVRSEVVNDIGYLDERYFAYQEDTDYCFMAYQAGWKTFYLPIAKVMHFGGRGGSRSNPYKGIYEWHRSYFLYYQKNLAKDYLFLVNWFMYSMVGFKLAFALIRAFFSREKVVGSKKP